MWSDRDSNSGPYKMKRLLQCCGSVAATLQIKSNQINFIGIKSSHRTVTSHMYTITQLHVQLQSQIDPYTNVFLYIYIYIYRLN